MNVIFGAIDIKGEPAIKGSEHWTSKKVADGTYEITFTPPFATIPVVVVTGYIPRTQGGASSDNAFSVGPISETSVTVRSYDVASKTVENDGKLQNAEFTFIAIAN